MHDGRGHARQRAVRAPPEAGCTSLPAVWLPVAGRVDTWECDVLLPLGLPLQRAKSQGVPTVFQSEVMMFSKLMLMCACFLVCGELLAEQAPSWPIAGEPAVAGGMVMDAAADRPAAATRSFKAALSSAAAAAHREGKITRWQLARLRLAIAFRPDAMAEVQACVIDQGIQDGVLKDGADAVKAGFDWQRLLAFLQEWLPKILQIIAVFQ